MLPKAHGVADSLLVRGVRGAASSFKHSPRRSARTGQVRPPPPRHTLQRTGVPHTPPPPLRTRVKALKKTTETTPVALTNSLFKHDLGRDKQ